MYASLHLATGKHPITALNKNVTDGGMAFTSIDIGKLTIFDNAEAQHLRKLYDAIGKYLKEEGLL